MERCLFRYIINGALFHSVTLATGIGPEIFTFATDSNDVIDLIYNAGSWDDENTYNLIDNSGNLIISQGAFGFVPNLSAKFFWDFCLFKFIPFKL